MGNGLIPEAKDIDSAILNENITKEYNPKTSINGQILHFDDLVNTNIQDVEQV